MTEKKRLIQGAYVRPLYQSFALIFYAFFYAIIESSDKPLCLSPSLVILF